MTKFLLNGRAVVAGVFLCLSLAACGGGDDNPGSAPGTGQPGNPGQPGDPGKPDDPNPSLRCAP